MDSTNGNPLPNAEFIITCVEGFSKGETYNLTSDTKGSIKAELEYGKYQIDEVTASEGYVLNTTPIPFEITGNGQRIDLQMTNERIRGSVELIKLDTETNKPLANAYFEITCIEGFAKRQTYNLKSNENGSIKADLQYGKYEINEVRTPTGYILNNTKIPFEITQNGQKIDLQATNDRIKGNVVIHKIDANDKKPLNNIKFKITCLYGFLSGKSFDYITDTNGNINIDNLQFGKYKIIEIQTLDGYVLNKAPLEFEITKNGQNVEFTIEDRLYIGNVTLKKIDEVTKKSLPGIVFELYKGNHLIGEYTTDENGEIKVKNLTFGQYFFKEISTIQGYVLDNKSYWNFGIVEDNQEVNITAVNRKIKSVLELTKLDSFDGSILSGAKMLLIGADPTNSDIRIEFTTDAKANIFTLPFGNYEINDIEAPEGYILNNNIFTLKVTEDNKHISISINNDRVSYGK